MSPTEFRADADRGWADDGNVEIVKVFAGKAFGLRQPTFLARVRLLAPDRIDWRSVDALMAEILVAASFSSGKSTPPSFEAPLLGRVAYWATKAQREIGLPIFDRPSILQRCKEDCWVVARLAVPYAPGRLLAAVASLRWATRCAALLTSNEQKSDELLETLAILTDTLRNKLHKAVSSNTNTYQFLKAANARGIPWDRVAGNVYQFGWGAKARLMDGARTDATSNLGRRIYRNKDATAEALRRIGLPGPIHKLAASPEEAEEIAAQLGFPVVVKPADRDRGIGVLTDLRTPDQVRSAYLAVSKVSSRILVEKHANGRDYRLVVFNGELIWAFRRQPGGVTGDGTHTVTELTQILNADPRRGYGTTSQLKPLRLDAEAADYLSRHGMTVESVPSPGAFIRLRGAANIASGGVPIEVRDIHPDNRRLAVDVANAIRLDFAGLDILIEDISRSWHEVGATICEVNGDPDLAAATQDHLYGQVLEVLCKGSGRIPSVVIVGAARASAVAELAGTHLSKLGYSVGVARSTEARVGGRLVTAQVSNVFVATQMLIANRKVNTALVVVENDAVLETSLPFDLIDVLVIVNDLGPNANRLQRVVRMLAPNSAKVIVGSDSDVCISTAAHIQQSKLRFMSGCDGDLAVAVVEVVRGI